ncbi:MAG: hypothetical protein IH921_08195, partial [Gemmatimonadetes bacterium]|nr:hypothetical protein [Gemmatimonadota bacterium]
DDAARARSFGAHGIGLCRTEHMFFQEERLVHIREMLMNTRREGTEAANGAYENALKSLEEYQTSDFRGILEAMDGLPVVIRLLDTPGRFAVPYGPEKTPRQVTLGIESAVLTLEVHATNGVERFTHRGRKCIREDPPGFRRRRSHTYDPLVQPECLGQEACHRLHVSELPRGDAHPEGLATDGQLDTRAVEHRSPNRGDLHTGVVLARRLLPPKWTLGHLYLGGSGDDQASTQQPAREKHPPTHLHPGLHHAQPASH